MEATQVLFNEPAATPVHDSDSLKMWKALHSAFDYFNDELFHGRLDRNRVVLNCSRQNRALGFFRFEEFGWGEAGEQKAEISINPDYMTAQGMDKIYSTLVHELCHYEQSLHGTLPKSRAYHNKEWANMMSLVGLKSFNTSDPTKATGLKCSHTIVEGGPFDNSMKKMPTEFRLPIMGLSAPRAKASSGYNRWSCPECGQICRAKNSAELACLPCSKVHNKIIPLESQ